MWLCVLCQSQVDKHILTRQSGTEQSRGRVASALSSLTLMSFWQMEVRPKLVLYERFHICLLAGLLPPVFIGYTEYIYSSASCFCTCCFRDFHSLTFIFNTHRTQSGSTVPPQTNLFSTYPPNVSLQQRQEAKGTLLTLLLFPLPFKLTTDSAQQSSEPP